MKTRGVSNPILPGFHPDPSALKVVDQFYVATSTFKWWPGVAIHRSQNLADGVLAVRPLDRVSPLDLRGVPASGGIWAPNLTWHDGLFWLVYTDVKNLYAPGFDPAPFHEEDRHWLINLSWDDGVGHNRFGGIVAQEYDPENRALVGPITTLYPARSTRRPWPGPGPSPAASIRPIRSRRPATPHWSRTTVTGGCSIWRAGKPASRRYVGPRTAGRRGSPARPGRRSPRPASGGPRFHRAAGLIGLYDHENWYSLARTLDETQGGPCLKVLAADNGAWTEEATVVVPPGPLAPRMDVDGDRLRFWWAPATAAEAPLLWNRVGRDFDASKLSDEHCREGWFTGAMVSLCCQDLSGRRRPADFDTFTYADREAAL